MSTALELVFRYRQLIGACDAGAGMSIDDIEVVNTIESLYQESPTESETWNARPRLGGEDVELTALLRSTQFCDGITVTSIGPERLRCTGVPFLGIGDRVEVIFNDEELLVSYRFMTIVHSIDERPEDTTVNAELRFTGVPLLLRYSEKPTTQRPRTQSFAEGTPVPETCAVNSKA